MLFNIICIKYSIKVFLYFIFKKNSSIQFNFYIGQLLLPLNDQIPIEEVINILLHKKEVRKNKKQKKH